MEKLFRTKTDGAEEIVVPSSPSPKPKPPAACVQAASLNEGVYQLAPGLDVPTKYFHVPVPYTAVSQWSGNCVFSVPEQKTMRYEFGWITISGNLNLNGSVALSVNP